MEALGVYRYVADNNQLHVLTPTRDFFAVEVISGFPRVNGPK